MARWFSNQFDRNTDGVSLAALPVPAEKVDPKLRRGQRRAYVCWFYVPTATVADEVRLCSIESSSRILGATVSHEAIGANTIQYGLAYQANNHDGAVIDAECIAGGQSTASFRSNTQVYAVNTGAPLAYTIGMPIWEMLDLSYSTAFGTDPKISFDVIATLEVLAGMTGPLTFVLDVVE